jgi:LacI family transcriptional regulator
MTTLEEIAEIAGVSRSTVSRVVNNNPSVKDETRKRVLDVIRDVNFQPSTAARRLAGGRSGIIGLVIPMGVARIFTDPYFPILLKSVSATCNENSSTVMLWLAEPDYERRLIAQIINNDLLDGVIVSSMPVDDPIVDALSTSQIPFVLIGRHKKIKQISFVDIDNVNGAKKIVKHLVANEKTRIGTITGPKNMMVSHDRLTGYKFALEEAGLKIDSELILDGNFTDQGGYLCGKQLVERGVDAIFAASDLMALGAIRALKELGKNIPDDIAVVGFDDAPFSSTTDPPLTTVHQPTEKLGYQAVNLLTKIIENKVVHPKQIMLPVDIVIRKSG